MAPAVELFCDRCFRENSGEPRGSETCSQLCVPRCCVEACFISHRLYKEQQVLKGGGTLVPEHTRTSLGHSRKLLTRVLTALCSTLALRCWHLSVRLSSLANAHKSGGFIHHLFWCQLSKLGTRRNLFSHLQQGLSCVHA